jgi:outer membrane receptor for ferrienterochelin and colicin
MARMNIQLSCPVRGTSSRAVGGKAAAIPGIPPALIMTIGKKMSAPRSIRLNWRTSVKATDHIPPAVV